MMVVGSPINDVMKVTPPPSGGQGEVSYVQCDLKLCIARFQSTYHIISFYAEVIPEIYQRRHHS